MEIKSNYYQVDLLSNEIDVNLKIYLFSNYIKQYLEDFCGIVEPEASFGAHTPSFNQYTTIIEENISPKQTLQRCFTLVCETKIIMAKTLLDAVKGGAFLINAAHKNSKVFTNIDWNQVVVSNAKKTSCGRLYYMDINFDTTIVPAKDEETIVAQRCLFSSNIKRLFSNVFLNNRGEILPLNLCNIFGDENTASKPTEAITSLWEEREIEPLHAAVEEAMDSQKTDEKIMFNLICKICDVHFSFAHFHC